mmetsp:Transcript_26538/g.63663  ORF Transcript_26538/g.63663 Transcript_26538/m.63663 type:complete len:97 (-) Transcript_26538:1725-2015(-)
MPYRYFCDLVKSLPDILSSSIGAPHHGNSLLCLLSVGNDLPVLNFSDFTFLYFISKQSLALCLEKNLQTDRACGPNCELTNRKNDLQDKVWLAQHP